MYLAHRRVPPVSGTNKTRTTPFRLLAYFLYGRYDWIEQVSPGVIRIQTGPAARTLRVRSADFWQYLYWLETSKLVESIDKEQKRGSVLVRIKVPTALADKVDVG